MAMQGLIPKWTMVTMINTDEGRRLFLTDVAATHEQDLNSLKTCLESEYGGVRR